MNVFVYILDTLADWEVGYILAELNSGRFLEKSKESVNLVKVGCKINPITTMGGISITPDDSIDNLPSKSGDLLVLPGADTWLEDHNKKVLNLIPNLLNDNVIVAAICGSTIALANNGVLNSRKHTSNDKEYLKMTCPNYSGEKLYIDHPVVTDGNLITASGLAPLEFAHEIFKKIDVMQPDTLEAWYQLNKTRKAKYFYDLMDSLK